MNEAAELEATFFHWVVLCPPPAPTPHPKSYDLCLCQPFVQLENSFPALAGHMVKGKGIATPKKRDSSSQAN